MTITDSSTSTTKLVGNLTVSRDFTIAETDDRLFGSFVEHMGSVIYNGVYEPGHPTADKDGFRQDVMNLARELMLRVVRYPGGNYTSGYRWEDGVGPRASRPTRLESAWKQIEPNQFGLNEFMKWVGHLQADPIMTINLGTRGVEDAQNVVEYCNFPNGTYWSDLRRSHGVSAPHGIKTWCVGNELDGEWQTARKTADEYGRLATEAAKVMKWVDSTIELVACGSSARHMSSYPEWDRIVLEHTYEHVDYLSLHCYLGKKELDTPSYLAMASDMERQICEIISACDYVKANKKSNKTMMLSFDEWNVWRASDLEYIPWQTGSPLDWVQFSMEDALVFGSAMLTLLRHCDRVKIACQSLLVNTIPLILTKADGPAWRNATFYPFMHVSQYGRGVVLQSLVSTPEISTTTYGEVPALDALVVHRENQGEITMFLINRSGRPFEVHADIRDFGACEVIEHLELTHESLSAANTEHQQMQVSPHSVDRTHSDDGSVTSMLMPYSWNVVRLRIDHNGGC